MGDAAEFAAGLLNPRHPVPLLVKGRIARRYAVYRNNVTVGFIRALEANFPVVRKLLGDQYFAGFARDFAQNHPPQSPLMFQYGAEFPKALESAEDLACYPYLGDIAQLEILWRESYHATDANVLASNAIVVIAPESLFDCRFKSHPSLRLIQSRFSIHTIFAANRPGGEDQVFDPALPQRVMVTRPNHDVEIHAITQQQSAFFGALKDGEKLGDALDIAAVLGGYFDLSATLALLLQSGAFQSIQTGNEQTK